MKKKKTLKRKQKNNTSPLSSNHKLFSEHLTELRYRVIIVIAFFVFFTIIGYTLKEHILLGFTQFFAQNLFFTSPTGGLQFYLQISMLFGAVATFPILIYHLFAFTLPAITHTEIKKKLLLTALSFTLFLLGSSFALFILIPIVLTFLLAFSNESLQAIITADHFVSFITKYTIGFGIFFQMPLVLALANSIKKISVSWLFAQQRWVLLFSAIVVAIVTPTIDIVNQLLFCIPIVLVYYISILTVYLQNKLVE